MESQRRWWISVPENHFIWVIIQASFTHKGEGCGCLLQISWCWPDPGRNVIILCSCPWPCRSGYPCKPPTRQMLLFVLQFLSPYEWKCVIFSVKPCRHSLEKVQLCILQVISNNILSLFEETELKSQQD